MNRLSSTANEARGRAAWVGCLFCLLAPLSGSASEEGGAAAVAETRAAIERWVETRRIISKEKRDLALSREMLNERIALMQREIEALREKIREAAESIAEADEKRIELVEENDRLRRATGSVEDDLARIEERTAMLLPRLPDPLRERVKPLSQRLPEDPNETKLSMSERFQNAVGILNEVNKFHREITVTTEIRPLPDGSSAEVAAIYLGIGQGFYTGAGGRVGGAGSAAEGEWEWEPVDSAAAAAAQALAILKKEQPAAYVRLPIEIE